MAALIVHGVPLSQPVRAVLWALVRKRKPFQLSPKVPGSPAEDGTRHPSFLAMNPGGTMPCLEEPDTGFVLGESNAILCYLARTNGWDDLYPSDPRAAAKVDWYLHFHHQSVRQASIGYIAPAFRQDLQIPEHIVGGAKAATEYALGALDTGRWRSRGSSGETALRSRTSRPTGTSASCGRSSRTSTTSRSTPTSSVGSTT